eukprot:357727-Pyramimonas_sp.AAC.2
MNHRRHQDTERSLMCPQRCATEPNISPQLHLDAAAVPLGAVVADANVRGLLVERHDVVPVQHRLADRDEVRAERVQQVVAVLERHRAVPRHLHAALGRLERLDAGCVVVFSPALVLGCIGHAVEDKHGFVSGNAAREPGETLHVQHSRFKFR